MIGISVDFLKCLCDYKFNTIGKSIKKAIQRGVIRQISLSGSQDMAFCVTEKLTVFWNEIWLKYRNFVVQLANPGVDAEKK